MENSAQGLGLLLIQMRLTGNQEPDSDLEGIYGRRWQGLHPRLITSGPEWRRQLLNCIIAEDHNSTGHPKLDV